MDGLNKACGVFQVHTEQEGSLAPAFALVYVPPAYIYAIFFPNDPSRRVSFYDVYVEGLQLSPVCSDCFDCCIQVEIRSPLRLNFHS